jgi:hypothetical protein
MGIKYKNYAEGTLTENLGGAAVENMVLSSNDGLKFPVITVEGDYFYATLVDVSGNREIVKVTEHQNGADVFATFVRAQDDTVAIAFAIGDKVQLRIPKIVIEELQTGIDLNTTHSASDGTDHSDVVLNNTHRGSDGTDHSDVVLNNTHRASDGTDHSHVVTNDTHVAGDGSDHADVALNNTHRASNGRNHSDVVLNNTHRASNGTNHANVVSNNAHRSGDGSDHADVAANSAAGHAQNTDLGTSSETFYLSVGGPKIKGNENTIEARNTGDNGYAPVRTAAVTCTSLTPSGKTLVRDHAGGTSPEVINVIFGTGSPPAASSTPIGTLFIKYIA